jgi:hypothetical protein
MKRRSIFLAAVLAAALACFLLIPARPHGLSRISYEAKKGTVSQIATAINVYAKQGTAPAVRYERGTFAGRRYDVLTVTPGETTFIQLDYAGDDPKTLEQLYDRQRTAGGYWRVGGINGGFFNDGSTDHGRPTGAVLIDGEWQRWHNEELTPAYGNGNATVYFNPDGALELRYHGWQNGVWMPSTDLFWSYDNASQDFVYQIDRQYGLSGAYTLLKDGRRIWLGRSDSSYWNRSSASSVTLFGETADGRILLVIAQNIGGGEQETTLMLQMGAVNAIRLDGSTSTAMCVDRGLVNRSH